MPVVLAPLIDAVIVLIFATAGRRNHGEADAVSGILYTAWPFLVGAALGWLIVLLTRRSLAAGRSLSSGAIIWVATVALGMVLRHVTDRGVAVSFIIVALCFNGIFMLGWRLLAHLVSKRRADRQQTL